MHVGPIACNSVIMGLQSFRLTRLGTNKSTLLYDRESTYTLAAFVC